MSDPTINIHYGPHAHWIRKILEHNKIFRDQITAANKIMSEEINRLSPAQVKEIYLRLGALEASADSEAVWRFYERDDMLLSSKMFIYTFVVHTGTVCYNNLLAWALAWSMFEGIHIRKYLRRHLEEFLYAKTDLEIIRQQGD